MAWDVWIHACSHSLLGCGYGHESFHGCMAMVFLLNNTWWWMLLEAGFFPQWGFPRVYLVSHFMGMLSILLHVDFNFVFILDLLWVMWKRLYSLLPSFPTIGIRAWFWLGHGFKSPRCLRDPHKHLVCASRGRLLGDAMHSPTHRWLIMWCSMFTNSHGFWCNDKWASQSVSELWFYYL